MLFTKLREFYPASEIKYKRKLSIQKEPLLKALHFILLTKQNKKSSPKLFQRTTVLSKGWTCTPNYIIGYTLTGWLSNCECSLEPKSFPLTKPDTPPRESSFAHHKWSCNPCSEQSPLDHTQQPATQMHDARSSSHKSSSTSTDFLHFRTQELQELHNSEQLILSKERALKMPQIQDQYKQRGVYNVFCYSQAAPIACGLWQ